MYGAHNISDSIIVFNSGGSCKGHRAAICAAVRVSCVIRACVVRVLCRCTPDRKGIKVRGLRGRERCQKQCKTRRSTLYARINTLR